MGDILIEVLRIFFFILIILFIYASVKRIRQIYSENVVSSLEYLSFLILYTPIFGVLFMILGLFITSPIHRYIVMRLVTSNALLMATLMYQICCAGLFLSLI